MREVAGVLGEVRVLYREKGGYKRPSRFPFKIEKEKLSQMR